MSEKPISLSELVPLLDALRAEDFHVHHVNVFVKAMKDGKEVTDTASVAIVDTCEAALIPNHLALQQATAIVVKEYPKMTSIIGQVIETLAAQQREISELRAELEQVRSERVTVAVQDKAKDLLEQLATRGFSVGTQHFVIKLEEQEKAESSESSRTDASANKVAGGGMKLSGLMKLLADLKIDLKVDEESVTKNLKTAHVVSSQTKRVSLDWRVEGLAPPTDPEAHARAYLARRRGEDSLLLPQSPPANKVLAPPKNTTDPLPLPLPPGAPSANTVGTSKPDTEP